MKQIKLIKQKEMQAVKTVVLPHTGGLKENCPLTLMVRDVPIYIGGKWFVHSIGGQ